MVNWEKINDTKVKMEIELPEEEVEEALEKAYREVVKKVDLPGFRKGKVPRKILEARFGPEVLYEDAVQYMVPEAYSKAIEEEEEIEPVDEPDIEVVQIEKGKPFKFNATVEVKPEVTLGLYKGVEVEVEKEEVDEKKVEEHLHNLRERQARLVTVEDEDYQAQEKDMIVIDFKGYLDGEPFEGGEAEDYSLELGSGSFIEGFEEQLVGARTGEEKEVKVTFPEDYEEESLAGQEVLFSVTVKEIKRKELPDLDDDFAKEVSEFETLEEFKEDLWNKFQEEAKNQYQYHLEEAVINKVADNSEVAIPEGLVEKQLDRMIEDIERRLGTQGLKMEQFLQLTGKSVEDLKEEYREEAVKRVKSNLVLDAIIKAEGIEVEESEIEEKIQEIAQTYNDDPERVKDVFKQQGRWNMMFEEMRMRKVIDMLVENAQVIEKPPESSEEERENQEEQENED